MALVVAGALLLGCGAEPDPRIGDVVTTADDPGATRTSDAVLAPCEGRRHLMLMMFEGVLTPSGELETWHANEGYEMATIPGASALATAYHERGLEVVYVVGAAGNIELHGVPYAQAVEEWLSRNGFPTGDRATLLLEAGPQRILQEMISATVAEGSVYGAYVSDPDLVSVLLSGGAPGDRIYIVGDGSGPAGTSTIPEGDLTSHLALVTSEVEPVCKVH